ncbi:ribonuclease III domain-containing protein [Dendryphion nanum]|uniref:Ribonuclease III domain-containing protein n=1 Tax=Dendryphion nanum TaxID=256645 RepID=A0A9P9I8K1_9PLEO|nr:ribonuclease III domain-containing protein [Dendryphion nanum]
MSAYESLQDKLGYHFSNMSLLGEAFLAAGASVSRSDIEGPVQGNKRLALVGDAVLRLCILDDWYPKGTDTESGDNLVQDIGTNEKLRTVAKEWNLTDLLKENPCQQGEKTTTTLASTVEAVIGAVWLDSQKNLGAVKHLIKRFQS